MPPSIIDRIRDKQKHKPAQLELEPPRHRPEMLYIGCIDARLDPVADIGIPQGKALIYRNIAALVRPSAGSAGVGEEATASAAGEIPESVSMGAALEFFINHIPAESKKKHIVVSGHTHCGGIQACLHESARHDHYLPRYLSALKEEREKVLKDPALFTDEQRHRALEEACVRASIANLMTYDTVRLAVEEGRVELHGWVIDTASKRISEMDANGVFQPLSQQPGRSV